ncbi:MAG: hypothetical protein SFV54_25130 [Bryobacteraceae bacterium]|nr:hypothetical protein [Bryobacteraceae bacterium]
MTDKTLAHQAGRFAALGVAGLTLTEEHRVTASPVYRERVGLEPVFQPVDPAQTAAGSRRSLAAPARVYDWTLGRLLLSERTMVEWPRATDVLRRFLGIGGPVSLECALTRGAARFYLGAPSACARVARAAWLAGYPETAVEEVADHWRERVPVIRFLADLYSPRPYHAGVAATISSPWASLLRLAEEMEESQRIDWQCVMTPVQYDWPANIAALLALERGMGVRAPYQTRNTKNTGEPLFACAVRIAASDAGLARGIAAYVGTFTADGIPWRWRSLEEYEQVLSADAVVGMLADRAAHTTGQLLTLSELALFVHLPDRPAAGGVALEYRRGLPVPLRLQQDGVPLGVNERTGRGIAVYQPLIQQNRSAWYLGRSRMGKSSAIVHRCRYLATRGGGVGLIDPHRVTAFALLGSLGGIPLERAVFLDFDAALPVAYNAFAGVAPQDYGRLTTEYVHSLKHLFEASSYHRMTHILGNCVYALFVLGENLASLPMLLSRTPAGESFRRLVIARAPNLMVQRFWSEEFPSFRSEAFAPIINRLSALLLDDRTLRTFVQPENRVCIPQILADGRVLIVAPPASVDAASIVGGFLIAQLKQAAFARVEHAGTHFQLVVDEWHRFITSTKSIEQIINETAKAQLSIVLANQETGQLPSELLQAVSTIPNVFVFGVNLHDAKLVAPFFGSQVSSETLAGQRTGEVHARIEDEITSFVSYPPLVPDQRVAGAIIAASLAAYHVRPSPRMHQRVARVIDTF